MSLKKYFRRNLYKWHRITSLVVALPVLLWTVSGFLHPVMNAFRPVVKNSLLPAAVLDTTKVKVSLPDALVQNKITTLQNFRFITLDKKLYYQIKKAGQDTLAYISCENGQLLKGGDSLYAAALAQRLLSEDNKENKNPEVYPHHATMAAGFTGAAFVTEKKETWVVQSKVLSTTLLSSFNKNYKRSNKILPVYEVAFDGADGIRLYMETGADRLALASDKNRRWFAAFFSLAHSWSFLDGLGKTKSFLLGSFSALCFLTSVFGFAVYNVLNKKKVSTAGKRWHRVMGNVFLITTLLYSFSGAWHAFARLPERPKVNQLTKASFNTADIPATLPFSSVKAGERLMNISLVKNNGKTEWQVSYKKRKESGKRYINCHTGLVVPDGDEGYAASLACRMKGAALINVKGTKTLTVFSHRYSMMNKRLPVVEVAFADGEIYYIETATGALAAITRPADKAERFSFSNLHIHHYWEMWLGKECGKTVRNTVLITTTLGLLLLALTGMFIYIQKRARSGSIDRKNKLYESREL